MAYYYVKNGGTASGDAGRATSMRTGSFASMGASAYYDEIAGAINATTAPATGDFILLSSSHNKAYSATATLTFGAIDISLVSVDDSNADTYLAGAQEDASAGLYNWVINTGLNSFVSIMGIDIVVGNDITFSSSTSYKGVHFYLRDVSLECTGASNADYIRLTGDGVFHDWHDVDVKPANGATNDAGIYINGGGTKFTWVGGTFNVPANMPDSLIAYVATGGGTVVVDSVDLSALSKNIYDHNATQAEECEVLIKNCSLHSSVGLVGARTLGPTAIIQLRNCDSANTKYRLEYASALGSVVTETSIYRTASIEGQSASLEFASNANTSNQRPLRVKISDIIADTSSAATATVEIAQDGTTTALTDSEIWLEFHYQDDTTTQTFVEHDGDINPLSSGTDQTNSVESWTGLSGTNKKQSLSVTTTNTGKSGWCEAWVCLAKPSTTVYVCPEVDIT